MRTPRRFRKTEIRVTASYVARCWFSRVLRFSGPAEYVSWLKDHGSSGADRREFIAEAANVIRMLSPPLDGNEKVKVLDSLSALFASFRNTNEMCAWECAELTRRFEAVVGQMSAVLKLLVFDADRSADLPPRPWSLLEESCAVARALKHQVLGWHRLEQLLGLEAGTLAAMVKANSENAEEFAGRPGNPGGRPTDARPAEGSTPLPLRDRLLQAICTGEIEMGTAVRLPTSPVAFLRMMPVVRGGLVDAFSLRLAEYGTRLAATSKRKFLHSLLWSDLGLEFAQFDEHADEEDNAKLIHLKHYLEYSGRIGPGNLAIYEGVVISSLEKWLWSILVQGDWRDSDVDDNGGNNAGLAEWAVTWVEQMAALKADADKLKLSQAAQGEGGHGLFSGVANRFDSLTTGIACLSTYCFVIAALAAIAQRRQVDPDPDGRGEVKSGRQTASAAASTAQIDLEPVLVLLKRIAQERWKSVDLMPLIRETVRLFHDEMAGPYAGINERLKFVELASTFDEIVNDLRSELGWPLPVKSRGSNRVLADFKLVRSMEEKAISIAVEEAIKETAK